MLNEVTVQYRAIPLPGMVNNLETQSVRVIRRYATGDWPVYDTILAALINAGLFVPTTMELVLTTRYNRPGDIPMRIRSETKVVDVNDPHRNYEVLLDTVVYAPLLYLLVERREPHTMRAAISPCISCENLTSIVNLANRVFVCSEQCLRDYKRLKNTDCIS